MLHARRSLSLLLGASVSAGAGYLYIGDEAHYMIYHNNNDQDSDNTQDNTKKLISRKRPPVKALSKADVGLEQSLARQIGYWISSATVYTATQAFYASAGSNTGKHKRRQIETQDGQEVFGQYVQGLEKNDDDQRLFDIDNTKKMMKNKVYHRMFGWFNDLSMSTEWDGNKVIQSSSFTMLLNLVSSVGHVKGIDFTLKEELETEMYRAVGFLATNATCAKAIAERGTRYGKLALLNLSRVHDMDPRVGAALHRLVVLDSKDCKFGPANLMSLIALAIEDVPDQYMEFALWGLTKATSQNSLSATYEWRKALFGDDTVAKNRKKLLSNEKLWDALIKSSSRPDTVQFQAARLMKQLSEHLSNGKSGASMSKAFKETPDRLSLIMTWLKSDHIPLVCTALDIVSNLAADREVRDDFVRMGTIDMLRSRMIEENQDCRLTAGLLHAVQKLSRADSPLKESEKFMLDKDSLSFYHDEHADPTNDPHEDFSHPHAVISGKYVDGWIELFSSFLRDNEDAEVRQEAALCLEQIVLHGQYRHQALQEWLLAALDAVLEQVPLDIAIAATSVRDAKNSRTRPIVGNDANDKDYEASHAKALKALAFVLDRKECQQELARLGGIELLRTLISFQSSDPNMKRETARLIANVLACDEMDEEIRNLLLQDESIMRTLSNWVAMESDIKLQFLAHRALLNLNYQKRLMKSNLEDTTEHEFWTDRQHQSPAKYLDGINPLHINNNEEKGATLNDYNVDVIFLHGLLGCAHETWVCGEDAEADHENADVWANKWLVEDLKREGLNPRVLSVGYDSNLLASDSAWETMCFKKTSEEILHKLQEARVGSDSKRPVIFVTHSLGGVLLKQVLLDSVSETSSNDDPENEQNLLDNVNGVVFYGVPHHGSPIAQTIQNLKIKSLGIYQHPVTEHLHGTPHSQMLNEWCKDAFQTRGIPALSLGENLPCKLPVIGFEALVVPPSSADPGFGEFVSLSDATHTNVCKPSSKEDQRYVLAKEFITKQLSSNQTQASSLDVI